MPFSNNPIDTKQQRAHELLALEYFNHPDILAVRAKVKDNWLSEVQPSSVMLGCFDAAFEEVMFGAVIWALNQDPLYPKCITISRVEHDLPSAILGEEVIPVPGSRWGIDNPDSIYRVIPISGNERYELRGRVYERRLVENYFTLWDPQMQTVGLLSGRDLVIDEKGHFTISVDSEPANGRVNHIQTTAAAHEFYIRDVIADWAKDRANELSVVRLGAEPNRAPQSESENLALITEYMHKWAGNTTRWNNQALHKPANDFSFTIDRDSDGALRNQIYIMGHFELPEPDSALVLSVNMGGAAYFIAPITNVWGTSNYIVDRNGCLNMTQAMANQDGTYTFVISLDDPGVANWLDPSDMREGILTLRWAEFPNDIPLDSLGVSAKMQVQNELGYLIDQGVASMNVETRKLQLQKRASSYQWRL